MTREEPTGNRQPHREGTYRESVDLAPILRPFASATLAVSNRIVMAPMTRGFAREGVPGDDAVRYYERRALNGVGLIITEGTIVDGPTVAPGNIPRFFGDEQLAGWKLVLEAVHTAGGKIVPQLWHTGGHDAEGEIDTERPPVAPSGLGTSGKYRGEPMTTAEIDAAIGSFASATADARALGFDGVELHGGHGFLLDQFFWSATNKRTDRYGGDIRARSTFAAEVVAACREAAGDNFPLIFRFSQWKMTDYRARLVDSPSELGDLLGPLVQAGVDVFHCSTRRIWKPEFDGDERTLASWTKAVTGKPVIAVGCVGLKDSEFHSAFEGIGAEPSSLDLVNALVADEQIDLVAVGRALLADPEWARKIAQRRDPGDMNPFRPSALASLD